MMKAGRPEGRAFGNGKAKRGALVVGSVVLAASVIGYGFAVSCSGQPESQAYEATQAATEDGEGEENPVEDHFFGEENWAFMSEESLASFEREFYAWLIEGGMEDGSYVYLHAEDISCTDGIWTAYARTPQTNTFYKVAFDATAKEISFEEVPEPEFAKKAQTERETIDAVREGDVAERDEAAPADRRDASENVALDDPRLAELLPKAAAESLPAIISEYAAGKGIATSPTLCSVYPRSVSTSGDTTSFEMLVYDAQKAAFMVEADYSASNDSFGFSLSHL